MKQGCAPPIHGRRNALIKNTNHVGVADTEDNAVQRHRIADAKLAHVGFRERSFESVFGHSGNRNLPKSVSTTLKEGGAHFRPGARTFLSAASLTVRRPSEF